MKKYLKKIPFLALLMLLISIMAVNAFATTNEGLSFTKSGDADKWHMRKPLESAPYS